MKKIFRLELPLAAEEIETLLREQESGRELSLTFKAKDIKVEPQPEHLPDASMDMYNEVPNAITGIIEDEVMLDSFKCEEYVVEDGAYIRLINISQIPICNESGKWVGVNKMRRRFNIQADISEEAIANINFDVASYVARIAERAIRNKLNQIRKYL